MKSALIELQFLPPISYFSLLSDYNEIILERFEHYIKQTYRNRCYINTASGRYMLVVPLTEKHGKVLITSIKIDYAQKWVNRAWRSIQSAYGKAPFFGYYADDLHDVFYRKFTFLYDLNLELLSLCLKWLQWDIPVMETKYFEKETFPPIYDLRNTIVDKKEQDGLSGYSPVAYQQVFGSKFVPHLSLLDLIYCQGPDAARIIGGARKSQ
ncbi:MAG TPA: WbqC family protein [Cyclobacteriaceae bacterium]|nr:WbqC family protein [Cyclobacteriaceae bacterium]